MNKIKRTFIVAVACLCYLIAPAQNSNVKNVAKSVFTLTTYKADGSLLETTHGLFVGENNEGISQMKPFLGAATAVVTDAKGRQMNVTRMVGINEMYDLARFRVDGKTTPATLSATAETAGSQAWIVGYDLKKPMIKEAPIKKVESFNEKYNYYIFDMDAPEGAAACPLVNQNGQVLALVQPNTSSFGIHATDANYAANLTLTGLYFSDVNIRQIGIPTLMSENLQQAQFALLMAGQSTDSVKYAAAIDDFTTLFPDQPDGYEALARWQMNKGQFAASQATMDKAIKNVNNKDEAHYQLCRIIYDKELYQPDKPYPEWSLDKAMEEAQTAYDINPTPLYKHIQGQIMFSKKEYQPAYDIFTQLHSDKSYSSPELLYEAARCKQMMKAPVKETLALLDSAINTTDTLQIRSTAPYFLTRAEVYLQADSFRQAVFDYTRYEYLMQGNVNANFYYLREQAEVKGRLFQQALSDISRCVLLEPNEPLYYAEMAQLQLRVNMVELALESARRCTQIAPDYSDGFLLLGLAQVKHGEKEQGLANMQKAKELGNEQAEALIAKYK